MRLGLALCFLACPAAAQEVNCANAQAQVEMTYCAEQDWKAADVDLNTAYKAAMAVMQQIDSDLDAKDRGAVDNLRAAQRAWITFRDAACAAEGYPMHGGTAAPMVIYTCRARLTEERTTDLGLLTEPN